MDNQIKNFLLEILHIIESDGNFSDKEALIQILKDNEVSQHDINYHLR